MAFRKIFVHPKYPENLKNLFDLAYNLWAQWDNDSLRLFTRVDAEIFRKCDKNPVEFLYSLPQERLSELSRDKAFLDELENVWEHMQESIQTSLPRRIAYFSMEFGLYHLPIYAGGLGMLAGDHMKGASDMDLPIVGVGLYYRYGNFIQRINVDNRQEEVYQETDVHSLPMKEWKADNDETAFVHMDIDGVRISLKIWRVDVGRINLILLDANVPENPPEIREITNHLYVADREKRILQEIILGVGGFRALRAVGLDPEIYHLNEGHSAFLLIERLADLIKSGGLSFDEAAALVKATTVFTTHTPVEAGNENFSVDLIRKYLKPLIESLGVSFDEFIKLGFLREDPNFWLPALAIRFSQYINGVSQIHGGVSRQMWQSIFPGMDTREIPISGITNGVHDSWMSPEIRDALMSYLGTDLLTPGAEQETLARLMEIPDHEIWEAHMKGKRRMVGYLRDHVSRDWVARGYPPSRVQNAREMLNAGFLTIGFARRFASYKRPNLILKDRERLARILKNSSRPAQLIFAGKAHPADTMGKDMIKEILEFAREYGLEDRIFFVENYNRIVAEYLIQGCDVWLNNPIKPNEASGTSGMKAGMNGVLNLSVLDGWWPECFNGENGWAITAGDYYENPEMRDSAEANQIYDFLEEEVSGEYFDRDDEDIPSRWVKRMKNSIFTTAQGFSIERMLGDYQRQCYEPALKSAGEFAGNGRKTLKKVVAKATELKQRWDALEIRRVQTDIEKRKTLFAEDWVEVACSVFLDGVDPNELQVQVRYRKSREGDIEIVPLTAKDGQNDGVYLYAGKVQLHDSGAQELDVLLIPSDVTIHELYPDLIKWAT